MVVHPSSGPIINAMISPNVTSDGKVRQKFFCGPFPGRIIDGFDRPGKDLYIAYFQSPVFHHINVETQLARARLNLLNIFDLNGIDMENDMIPCGYFPDSKRASVEEFSNYGIRYTLFFIAILFLDEDDEFMIPEDFLRIA